MTKQEKRAISRIKYYNKNKEMIKAKQKLYYEKNKEFLLKNQAEALKIKLQNNPDYRKQLRINNLKSYNKNKEKTLKYQREHYYKNREMKTKKHMEYNRRKYKEDPVFRLRELYRSRINKLLKNRTERSLSILGCSWTKFKNHIEELFTPGMSWDKMGKEIHIDHIIPLALAKTEEDVKVLSCYVNLRPLWKTDNLKKGKKITI